jgi:hypothetical protein
VFRVVPARISIGMTRYEPGRFEVGRHLELLRRAGFKESAFPALFEHNLDHPTAAQNYACLIAVK